MLVFETQQDLRAHLKSNLPANQSIGFVPTMGALHDGHLSLLKKSLAENDLTVMSIFVNPTQFNNSDDLDKYPRTLEEDVKKVHGLDANIIIYAPTIQDIYQGNTVSEKFVYDGLEHQMEGKQRPGHFDGVGTIVKKLFQIVEPQKAYFGEKDYQQLLIIKKMVELENLPVEVIGVPIFRDENGLAMSSRNARLTADERLKAVKIFQTLKKSKEMFEINNFEEIRSFVENCFLDDPLMKLEYFEITDSKTLETSHVKETGVKYRAFIVVHVNDVRLIDTISLN